MGSPLRPVDEDIRFVEEAVHEWAGRSRAPRALLLGVTPEIYRLTWPSGTDLIAVDRTPAMIHAVWPGPRSAVRCADWTSMDLPAASRDIVMCDGGWHLLAYPTEQQALVRVLARVVADHGRVILRLFVPPRVRERPEDVLADLADGHIPNLNVLKLRLGMSMMASVAEGVELAAIWRRLNDAHPDLDALADRLGWSRDHARAIHAYRTSHARYHFASLADVRDMVSRDPGGFEVTAIREPSYHLGDRCLTMILARCGR
jgi:SAM-dependent methyltransferase